MVQNVIDLAFGGLRPRLPYKVTAPLQTLLGTGTIEYAMARWADPSNERGLEVNVFTRGHRLTAKLSDGSHSPEVAATPLVFNEIRGDGEEWTVAVGGHAITLFRSAPAYFGGNALAQLATDRPEAFIEWAVAEGTWV